MSARIQALRPEIVRLCRVGYSNTEIAEHVGCSDSTIALIRAKAGLPPFAGNRGRAPRRRIGVPPPTPPTPAPIDPDIERYRLEKARRAS